MLSMITEDCSFCRQRLSYVELCMTHERDVMERSLEAYESSGVSALLNSLGYWLRSKKRHHYSSRYNYSLDLVHCSECRQVALLRLQEHENVYANPLKMAWAQLTHAALHVRSKKPSQLIEVSLSEDECRDFLLFEQTKKTKNIHGVRDSSAASTKAIKPKGLYSLKGLCYGLLPGSAAIALGVYMFKTIIFEPFDFLGMMMVSLLAAIPAALIYLGGAFLIFKSTRTGKSDFLFAVVVGGLSMLFLMPTALVFVNGYFDTGSLTARDPLIVKIEANDDNHQYYAYVKSWREGEDFEMVEIKKSEYDAVKLNQTKIEIKSKPGRLGYEWLAGYKLID